MSERHHTEDELAVLLHVPAGDPRLTHVASCARCRARLAEYHAFLAAAAEVPEGEAHDAGRRLADFLDREVAGTPRRPAHAGPTLAERLGAWWRSPVAGPALAFAAVVAVVGGVTLASLTRAPERERATEEGVMRGSVAPEVRWREAAATPEGGLRLGWAGLAGADAYEVVVVSTTLEEVAHTTAARDTALDVAPERLAALAHGDTMLVRVRALRGGVPIAESRLEPLVRR